jgi:hypothetical protein
MGYRSDVLLAIVFKTKEQRDEVWAVYVLDKRVQEYGLANEWRTCDNYEYPMLYLEQEHSKWYESFEDVQGFEHLQSVAQDFADLRDFEYAWLKLRIGEETNDIEEEYITEDPDGHLQEQLYNTVNVERSITHSLT